MNRTSNVPAAEKGIRGLAKRGAKPGGQDRRLTGQLAYHLTRPSSGTEPDVAAALTAFEAMSAQLDLPFVAFLKANGLAYCHWQLGDAQRGLEFARDAERYAGVGAKSIRELGVFLSRRRGAQGQLRAPTLSQRPGLWWQSHSVMQ